MSNTTAPLKDGFHTKALDDGNVEFAFVAAGNILLRGQMAPPDVGIIATNLLACSHTAFHNADRSMKDQPEIRTPPVPVTRWTAAMPKGQGQPLSVIIESGETAIAYAIPATEARAIARVLIQGSYIPGSMTMRAYAQEALRDFSVMLREIIKIGGVRLTALVERSKRQFVAVATGRGLRIFRRLDVRPGAETPAYAPVGKCIYCNSDVYSQKSGIRAHPLGAEHIIPEGIGGTLEIPEASCQKHEDTTGRLVEGDVLGRTLKALRVHLKLKKKGSGPHPKTLPLDATVNGQQRKIDIPVDDYPIVFMMLHFVPASFVPNNTEPGKTVHGAVVTTLKYDRKALYKKYGTTGFAAASWDSQMFSRMLAKIGHSLAMAELGAPAFKPLLLELICDANVCALNLIGGDPLDTRVPPSTALHEMELGYQRHGGKTYVVARIRLFAAHQGPRYYVVVGESLESAIARTRRVFSSKISRMLAR